MSDSGAPGWYQQPDQRDRYWDGNEWTDQWREAPAMPKKASKLDFLTSSRGRIILGVAVAAVVLAGIVLAALRPFSGAGALSTQAQQDRFAAVNGKCGNNWDLRDDGKTLIGDGRGKKDATGLSTAQLACPLELLFAPTAVVRHMDSTRALDGQQTDEWDGIKARWTYHPDVGFSITLVDTK